MPQQQRLTVLCTFLTSFGRYSYKLPSAGNLPHQILGPSVPVTVELIMLAKDSTGRRPKAPDWWPLTWDYLNIEWAASRSIPSDSRLVHFSPPTRFRRRGSVLVLTAPEDNTAFTEVTSVLLVKHLSVS